MFLRMRDTDTRIDRAQESQNIDELVRIVMGIKNGWREYLKTPGTWGYLPNQKLGSDALRINRIKAILREMPEMLVYRSLLQNLRLQFSPVICRFSDDTFYDKSTFKPKSKIIFKIIEFSGLIERCDCLFNRNDAIQTIVDKKLLFSFFSLLSDADGNGFSTFSRKRLYVEKYGYDCAWIERLGRDLYSYGVCYLDS